MKKMIFLVLFMISIYTNSIYSQKDWSKKLHSILVTEKDGKYTIEDFALIKAGGKSIQIKMLAIAPIDVMGRDNFISFYATYGTMIVLTLMEKAGQSISKIDIKTLDQVIGEPDIIIKFVIAKDGFQLQLTTDKGTKRKTTTWEELYDRN